MDAIHVVGGTAAHDALCEAFAHARESIDAEFYRLSDSAVIDSLNHAAMANVHVRLHVEAHPDRFAHRARASHEPGEHQVSDSVRRLRKLLDPRVELVVEDHLGELLHGKAAVIDHATAYMATANFTPHGFTNPGDVVIADALPADVQAVQANIERTPPQSSEYVVAGPSHDLRDGIERLLGSPHDLCIASESLSDPRVTSRLAERAQAGRHDRVLVGDWYTQAQVSTQAWLRDCGVDVRRLRHGYMHEKYVGDDTFVYAGSANLTRDGLDEAREVGIVAPVSAMPDGAAALRASFDAIWAQAVPV
jgi:phosphatidylserine/phosphatidylglycerophosphate/cardiolipin synthase-like enzyme